MNNGCGNNKKLYCCVFCLLTNFIDNIYFSLLKNRKDNSKLQKIKKLKIKKFEIRKIHLGYINKKF